MVRSKLIGGKKFDPKFFGSPEMWVIFVGEVSPGAIHIFRLVLVGFFLNNHFGVFQITA